MIKHPSENRVSVSSFVVINLSFIEQEIQMLYVYDPNTLPPQSQSNTASKFLFKIKKRTFRAALVLTYKVAEHPDSHTCTWQNSHWKRSQLTLSLFQLGSSSQSPSLGRSSGSPSTPTWWSGGPPSPATPSESPRRWTWWWWWSGGHGDPGEHDEN